MSYTFSLSTKCRYKSFVDRYFGRHPDTLDEDLSKARGECSAYSDIKFERYLKWLHKKVIQNNNDSYKPL